MQFGDVDVWCVPGCFWFVGSFGWFGGLIWWGFFVVVMGR